MDDHIDIHPAGYAIDVADRIDTCGKLGFAIRPDRTAIFAGCGPLRFGKTFRRKQQADMKTQLREAEQVVALQTNTTHMRRYVRYCNDLHLAEVRQRQPGGPITFPDDFRFGAALVEKFQHMLGDGIFHIGKTGFVLAFDVDANRFIIPLHISLTEAQHQLGRAALPMHVGMLDKMIEELIDHMTGICERKAGIGVEFGHAPSSFGKQFPQPYPNIT